MKALLTAIISMAFTASGQGSESRGNRIRIENGPQVMYQRSLLWGFRLGPRIGYNGFFRFEKDGNLHFENEPTFSLVNLSNEIYWKRIGGEGLLRWFTDRNGPGDLSLNGTAKYQIHISERLSLYPSVTIVSLVFSNWPFYDHLSTHSVELNTYLNMGLDIEF